ncbi:hypothetical protein [Streptomyces sp. NPDC021020]|uniref:hypothetical protein n=1 Tax=Streptomyces sp. NPDC021020 TaxID=3365109 RepID=UPI00379B18B0
MAFAFAGELPGTFLVHGATGGLIYSAHPVSDVVGDIVLVRRGDGLQALRPTH